MRDSSFGCQEHQPQKPSLVVWKMLAVIISTIIILGMMPALGNTVLAQGAEVGISPKFISPNEPNAGITLMDTASDLWLSTDAISIRLFDGSDQEVTGKISNVSITDTEINFDLSSLDVGEYLFEVSDGSGLLIGEVYLYVAPFLGNFTTTAG